MKKLIFTSASALMLCTGSIVAQTRNPGLDIMRTNIWRFGFVNFTTQDNAPGLDFSNGSPIAINCGQSVGDGATAISDSSGNLQLYGGYGGAGSQYQRMFNNTCNIMSNSGVVGDPNFVGMSQTNIAIPKPRSPDLIYYFSTSRTLKYSLVDINLDGGKGASIMSNVQLQPYPTGIKLAAVHHCNGSDIWVVGHRWQTDTFFAYLLTDTGITLPPVYTKIGPVDFTQARFQVGSMKFSSDGNKLAMAFFSASIPPYLFDFDKSSGIISHSVQLQQYNGSEAIAFSPDNSKLYIATDGGALLQYNLNAGNDSAIVQSRKLIANLLSGWFRMQLGRDGKIYLSSPSQPYSFYLDVINNPNALDTLCDFQIGAIYLNGSTGYARGLMNTVDSYFYTGSSAYPCYGDTTATNIAANETNLGIRVYPNPFSDYATIDIPNVLFKKGKIEYQLFDITGRDCKAQFTDRDYGITQLKRGHLKPGIYMLAIKLYGKTQTIKISIL